MKSKWVKILNQREMGEGKGEKNRFLNYYNIREGG